MLNPSALRNYNCADQSGRTFDQLGVVKQDPATTNCIYPQSSDTRHFFAPRQPY